MNRPPLRWGILGTAGIARKNWAAIRHAGAVVTAVASRDLTRARSFISACQARAPFAEPPRALDSYDQLVEAPEVDAVYLPLPTGLRKEWVLRAARARKHVLCEKPCAASARDLKDMIAACRTHGVQFMDGVMFMHSARLARVRETLDDGQTIGGIKRIAAQFSFRAPEDFMKHNIRMHSGLEPLGCLGDLGWYCIRFILWAMGWAKPRWVSGRLLSEGGCPDSPRPVPTAFSGELGFDRGVSASFYCSFLTDHQQWVHLSGERGHLSIEDFVLPFRGAELAFVTRNPVFNETGWDFDMDPRARRQTIPEHSHGDPNAQETLMFKQFASAAASGKTDTAWPEMSLATQETLEACLLAAR